MLRKDKSRLQIRKCNFFEEGTEYINFTVGTNRVKPNPMKVESISNLPEPKLVRKVIGLIKVVSYHRIFILKFYKMAETFINLIKKYARFKLS